MDRVTNGEWKIVRNWDGDTAIDPAVHLTGFEIVMSDELVLATRSECALQLLRLVDVSIRPIDPTEGATERMRHV
jgi:hypothetical protein